MNNSAYINYAPEAKTVTELKKSKRQSKIAGFLNPYTITIFIILLLYSISLIVPMLWAFFNSFKTMAEFSDFPVWFPKTFTLENYKLAFSEFGIKVQNANGNRFVKMPEMFLYSILYAGGCAFTATLAPCVMGYATAKFPYKFSKVITGIVIVCMILPIVGSLPSEIQMAKALGLYETMIGMYIMKGNFLGMYFLIFQNIFRGVPKTFSEAARIDGAGNFKIFMRIMMPLVAKTFLTIMLLRFIEFWNDYQTPMIYIKNIPTVAYGLFEFSFNNSNHSFGVPSKLAGAMAMMIPILIVYIIFRNKIMGNVTMGGLKE